VRGGHGCGLEMREDMLRYVLRQRPLSFVEEGTCQMHGLVDLDIVRTMN
jgi:hypothetical protein